MWHGEYLAWGGLYNENNLAGTHQPFRLQNQYCDKETGLHYNFFRYYDPNCGRFTTQDPIGLQGGKNFYAFAPNATEFVDVLGLDVMVIHNGRTSGNPFGHTAIAVEKYGLYSFGNAGNLQGINNNIIGGNYSVFDKYLRREAIRRNSHFTIIKTTAEQDKRIADALNKQTSKSGYFDNCSNRVTTALSELQKDMTVWQRMQLGNSDMFPVDAENTSKRYMRILGGSRWKLDKVSSEEEANNLIFNDIFKKFGRES